LSITMQPVEAAIGANFLEVEPPAQKIAKSKCSFLKEFSVNSFTMY